MDVGLIMSDVQVRSEWLAQAQRWVNGFLVWPAGTNYAQPLASKACFVFRRGVIWNSPVSMNPHRFAS